MIWQVRVHRDAAKQLEAIPPDRRKRILSEIDGVPASPVREQLRRSEVQWLRLSDFGNHPSQFGQLIQLNETFSGEHNHSLLPWCFDLRVFVYFIEDYGEVFVHDVR